MGPLGFQIADLSPDRPGALLSLTLKVLFDKPLDLEIDLIVIMVLQIFD